MADYPKINSRKMTRRQRGKLHLAIRYIRSRNPGPVSIRFEAVTIYKKKISATIKTRRDDAHPHSMRALICNERYLIFIGGSGGLDVASASYGISAKKSNRRHVKSMINSGMF